MFTIQLRKIQIMLGVQLPDTNVRTPCIFCHFTTDVVDDFEPTLQAMMHSARRVDDVFVFSRSTAPLVQYRVHCLGTAPTPNEKGALVTLFHVYTDLDRSFAGQLYTDVQTCGVWSLLVSFDDDEHLACFWLDKKGVILERSHLKRDAIDFMSPARAQLN